MTTNLGFKDEPIVTTLLNNDWYVFTMGQVMYAKYHGVQVRESFMNRDKNYRNADVIDIGELREQLAAIQALTFKESEIQYLLSQGIFDSRGEEWLRNVRLPEIHVDSFDGQLIVEAEGDWDAVQLYEVPVLGVVSELGNRAEMKARGITRDDIFEEGFKRLYDGVKRLREYPGLRLALFGARRRASAEWEDSATYYMLSSMPDQILGISNVELARWYNKPPSGTIAHKMFMVPAALHIGAGTENPIAVSQNEVLDHWEEFYVDKQNGKLLTHIPDTYGSEFYLNNLSHERVTRWHAYKQDSGSPFEFNDRLFLPHLASHNVDAREYTVVHSDGLTYESMIEIYRRYQVRINTGFGFGTCHSNNVGLTTHSQVWKPVSANGIPCVKLTDNAAKATGDAEMIELVKGLVGYETTYNDRPIV